MLKNILKYTFLLAAAIGCFKAAVFFANIYNTFGVNVAIIEAFLLLILSAGAGLVIACDGLTYFFTRFKI